MENITTLNSICKTVQHITENIGCLATAFKQLHICDKSIVGKTVKQEDMLVEANKEPFAKLILSR